MYADSLWAVAFFCSAVRGTLTNYTLDDTFPDIVYTQPPLDYDSFASLYDGGPLPPCHPGSPACFNGTSSVTGGTIIVPFTGECSGSV